MALSNLDKDNITRLFSMINLDSNKVNSDLEIIRQDYVTYGKLELIAQQIEFLRCQANSILETHELNNTVNAAICNFKRVPGNYYYLYLQNNKYIISLISNTEWDNYDKFIYKLFYDYDYKFKIIE